ncbi:hypothetical protein H4R33_003714 [Dimargaris cristalligena]|nr:hypothetical protein H4R33_003714 [Dimargaris cristalligena]
MVYNILLDILQRRGLAVLDCPSELEIALTSSSSPDSGPVKISHQNIDETLNYLLRKSTTEIPQNQIEHRWTVLGRTLQTMEAEFSQDRLFINIMNGTLLLANVESVNPFYCFFCAMVPMFQFPLCVLCKPWASPNNQRNVIHWALQAPASNVQFDYTSCKRIVARPSSAESIPAAHSVPAIELGSIDSAANCLTLFNFMVGHILDDDLQLNPHGFLQTLALRYPAIYQAALLPRTVASDLVTALGPKDPFSATAGDRNPNPGLGRSLLHRLALRMPEMFASLIARVYAADPSAIVDLVDISYQHCLAHCLSKINRPDPQLLLDFYLHAGRRDYFNFTSWLETQLLSDPLMWLPALSQYLTDKTTTVALGNAGPGGPFKENEWLAIASALVATVEQFMDYPGVQALCQPCLVLIEPYLETQLEIRVDQMAPVIHSEIATLYRHPERIAQYLCMIRQLTHSPSADALETHEAHIRYHLSMMAHLDAFPAHAARVFGILFGLLLRLHLICGVNRSLALVQMARAHSQKLLHYSTSAHHFFTIVLELASVECLANLEQISMAMTDLPGGFFAPPTQSLSDNDLYSVAQWALAHWHITSPVLPLGQMADATVLGLASLAPLAEEVESYPIPPNDHGSSLLNHCTIDQIITRAMNSMGNQITNDIGSLVTPGYYGRLVGQCLDRYAQSFQGARRVLDILGQVADVRLAALLIMRIAQRTFLSLTTPPPPSSPTGPAVVVVTYWSYYGYIWAGAFGQLQIDRPDMVFNPQEVLGQGFTNARTDILIPVVEGMVYFIHDRALWGPCQRWADYLRPIMVAITEVKWASPQDRTRARDLVHFIDRGLAPMLKPENPGAEFL